MYILHNHFVSTIFIVFFLNLFHLLFTVPVNKTKTDATKPDDTTTQTPVTMVTTGSKYCDINPYHLHITKFQSVKAASLVTILIFYKTTKK